MIKTATLTALSFIALMGTVHAQTLYWCVSAGAWVSNRLECFGGGLIL